MSYLMGTLGIVHCPKYSLGTYTTRRDYTVSLIGWPSLYYFLSRAFVKLMKATISFVISIRLFVRIEQLGSNLTDFHEI